MADPGFPRGGGANSPGGAPTYDFAKFSKKTAWNWKNLDPQGWGRASKILLCRSATDKEHKKAKDCAIKRFFKRLSLVLKHLKCAVFLPEEILHQLLEQK